MQKGLILAGVLVLLIGSIVFVFPQIPRIRNVENLQLVFSKELYPSPLNGVYVETTAQLENYANYRFNLTISVAWGSPHVNVTAPNGSNVSYYFLMPSTGWWHANGQYGCFCSNQTGNYTFAMTGFLGNPTITLDIFETDGSTAQTYYPYDYLISISMLLWGIGIATSVLGVFYRKSKREEKSTQRLLGSSQVNSEVFKWLAILSTLIALSVFLFSIVSSFYDWGFTLLEASGATYWSYRANFFFFSLGIHSWQYMFFDYWFNSNNQGQIGFLGMSWIPLTIFVMQALTLAFGCASLVINRRIIRFVPVCSSLTVLALISYVGYRLSRSNNSGVGYQLGYYLVYPSVVLFALAFALDEVRVRYLQSKEPKTTSNFS
jgi:hypothetical protein